MKANTPTPTTLREILDKHAIWYIEKTKEAIIADGDINEIVMQVNESDRDTSHQIQEQLKALVPEKRKTVKDTQGSIGMGWLLSEAEPFNEAIDQMEKAIEEWAK